MVWIPTDRLDVLRLAVAFVLSATSPSFVFPSKKDTTPLGAPPPSGVTIAVNATAWPETDGLRDELTVVVVLVVPGRTVCPPPSEPELGAKLPSPLYLAVIVWLPAGRVVVNVAVVMLPKLVTLTGAPKLLRRPGTGHFRSGSMRWGLPD